MVGRVDMDASVRTTLEGVLRGDIPLETNMQKGNFGEMMMDVYMADNGYTRIDGPGVTSLDAPTHHGIDGIYHMEGGDPPYIISESKYTSSGRAPRMGDTRDGPQMGEDWIKSRLNDALNSGDLSIDDYNAIRSGLNTADGSVGSQLYHISGDLNASSIELDSSGVRLLSS